MNAGLPNTMKQRYFERNHRNPSKHNPEERGLYLNWIKHNKKLCSSGELNENRMEMFEEAMQLCEKYRRVNQYV